ncbi:hypothetical protein L2E82_40504 [Cichorium intybus]|uniref:Uncharacterized protein n=1 Tax=Cichorium intybus TaxID=13427 RepID=A0ACB9AM55_CICIN|nr:hypothetical protein L2E82_40504 [Cichorium intybus]
MSLASPKLNKALHELAMSTLYKIIIFYSLNINKKNVQTNYRSPKRLPFSSRTHITDDTRSFSIVLLRRRFFTVRVYLSFRELIPKLASPKLASKAFDAPDRICCLITSLKVDLRRISFPQGRGIGYLGSLGTTTVTTSGVDSILKTWGKVGGQELESETASSTKITFFLSKSRESAYKSLNLKNILTEYQTTLHGPC